MGYWRCPSRGRYESNDRKFFIKYREIRNKIIELMDIDNPDDFVEHYLDENGNDAEDEFIMFIMWNIEKNTSAIRDKNSNDLAFVFKCVINNTLQSSLVQDRY